MSIKYFICLFCDDGKHFLLKDGSLSCDLSFTMRDLKLVSSRSYAADLMRETVKKYRTLNPYDWGYYSINTDYIPVD